MSNIDTRSEMPLNNGTPASSSRRGPLDVVIAPQGTHTDEVNWLAVSDDSRLLASAGNVGEVKLWDLDSGLQLWSRQLHPEGAMAAVFAGNAVVSGGRDGTIAITRLSDANVERRVSVGWEVRGLVITRNGCILACVDRQRIVAISLEGAMLGEWPAADCEQLALSPNGECLISAGKSEWCAWTWRGKWLELIVAVPAIGNAYFVAFESNDTVLLGGLGAWRWRIGGAITAITTMLEDGGSFIACSTDRRMLLANYSFNSRLSIFDSTSAAFVASTSFEGLTIRSIDSTLGSVTAVAMAPSGALITAHGFSGTIVITDGTNNRVRNLGVPIYEPSFAAIASNGFLVVAGVDGVRVFDTTTLTRIRYEPSWCVAGICPSGEWWVYAEENNVVVERLYGAPEIYRFTVTEAVRYALIHDDGRTVWIGDEHGSEIRDARDGHMLGERIAAKFSPYRPMLIVNGGFAWIDTDTLCMRRIGESVVEYKLQKIRGCSFDCRSAVAADLWPLLFVPQLARVRNPLEILIHDVACGERRHTIIVPKVPQNVALSPNGRELAVADCGGMLRIYNVTTGIAVAELAGHGGRVHSLSWSPDARFLIAAADDGATRIHVRATGDVLTLLASGNEWMIYDIEGFFDSSLGGSDLVAAIQGSSAFRIEQLAIRNNRPDLLLNRLAMPNMTDVTPYYRARYNGRLRKLGLADSALHTRFDHAPRVSMTVRRAAPRTAEVVIEAESSASELTSLLVSLNGVPLGAASGQTICGTSIQRTISISLSSGMNRIDAVVRNAAGAESLRVRRTIDACDLEKQKGALWFLGFGVSNYANPRLNLEWAHADANDLARYFLAASAQYTAVHVYTWTNEEATRAAIRMAKSILENAQAEDILVVFAAGHGMHDDDAIATYYFLSHDANAADLANTAVPFDVIESLLDNVAPRRKLMLLDTCASGDRDPTQEATRLDSAQRSRARNAITREFLTSCETTTAASRPHVLRRQNLIDIDLAQRTGAIVYSSCTGTEVSYEANGHGLFTGALLDVLMDPSNAATIPLSKLASLVTTKVATVSNGHQHPVIDRGNPLIEIELPIANKLVFEATSLPSTSNRQTEGQDIIA